MKKLANLLIGSAISLCILMPTATQAQLLLVTYTDSVTKQTASWNQELSPTPISSGAGQFTDVPITHFTASPSLGLSPYTDIIWFSNIPAITGGIAGGFATPYFNLNESSTATPLEQQYTGLESAPTFVPGTYGVIDFNNQDPGTLVIALVPPGAPGPIPGTGAAALAALALAGLYARARRA
ncbi:hypothetical protein [Methylocystis bryophila]|uniref:VPLPA-CTERM sorting domain-containing protein n=1 Tax=Methylocystis bryophila TaxID=655015 RepID=A0A1W6MV84_9HYPH|nr:hypothetical protein [Methylocystis bryophila]ARN81426.1 hypothetical protein B1812_10475 [Methylocystis bryophila]BDV37430.1 hypothetical protein DSM21852_06830 [Methylocystis bryophila]